MFGKNNNIIKLQVPKVRRKYKVNLKGDITFGSFTNTTEAETEWILSVREIYNDNSAMIELISFDTEVLNSKNEGFRELSIIANQFKKLSQEVVCIINKEGKIVKLINLDYIRERWNRLKNEMITVGGEMTDIEIFFKINNENFSSDQVLTELVNQLEFFKLYFNGLYGTKIPNGEWRKSENAFKTNTLEYEVNYNITEDQSLNQLRVQFKSCDYFINKKWIEKTYGGFPQFVNLDFCDPKYNIEGNYLFDKRTGLLNEATFIWEEFASHLLKAKTEYQITKI